MQARDAAALPSGTLGVVEGFQLLERGCPAFPDTSSLANNTIKANTAYGSTTFSLLLDHSNASVAVVYYSRAVMITGYRFLTSVQGPAAADPVRWIVEASSDGGTTWTEVGASDGYFGSTTGGLKSIYFPQDAYPTPTARGKWVEIQNRPPWQATASCFTDAEAALGFGSILIAALSGQDGMIKWCWIMMFSALATTSVIIAVMNGLQVSKPLRPFFFKLQPSNQTHLHARPHTNAAA